MILISIIASPIEILLKIIINKYLSESYCLTVISETSLNVNFPVSFTYINPRNTDSLVTILLILSDAGCSDYIVRMKDPEQFIVALEEVGRRSLMRRSDKKVIFLPVIDAESDILSILRMKESNFYAHLLFIVPSKFASVECKTFDLLTNRFVGPDKDTHLPVKLDTWCSCTKQFETNAFIFPHGLKNLNGKTVKVSTFTYKPYILLDVETSIAPIGRDGIEMRIIDEFCRWINCTVKIIRKDEEMWGEIYKNQTGIGILGSVYEGRSDIGIGALYSWFEEWEVMDFSDPGVRTAVTCLAPSPRFAMLH